MNTPRQTLEQYLAAGGTITRCPSATDDPAQAIERVRAGAHRGGLAKRQCGAVLRTITECKGNGSRLAPETVEAILEAARAGETYREIAERHGLRVDRVNKLALRRGVGRRRNREEKRAAGIHGHGLARRAKGAS